MDRPKLSKRAAGFFRITAPRKDKYKHENKTLGDRGSVQKKRKRYLKEKTGTREDTPAEHYPSPR
jgi:hypothetical protein